MSEFLFLNYWKLCSILTHLHFEVQMYNIIFTQRKSIKNFNRSLTILGGEVVGGASRTGNDGSGGSGGRWERWEVWERWEGVGGCGSGGRCGSDGRWWEGVGAVGGVGAMGGGGRAWERWEGWERWEVWEGVGAVGVVEVNYVLWLGGGVFDFFAGLIHSLSDAALL